MIFLEIAELKKQLNNSCDVVIREVKCGDKNINIIFLKSMVDEQYFISGILSPLIDFGSNLSKLHTEQDFNLDNLINEVLKTMDIEKLDKTQALTKLSENKVVLMLENEKEILAIDISKYPVRMPTEPPTSAVLKGPREGFVEDIKSNIALLRRRFSNDKLCISEMTIGRYSQTKVALAHVQGIADKKIVKQIKKKLSKIDIDGIIDSYYLVAFLQEKENSMFKQVGNYEKPDIVAAKILEGRIAILVDNSPIVLTLPFIFLEDLQSSNDYYSLSEYASYIRVVRLVGILFAIIVPGLYVALRLYHYSIVPLNFLITIANATEAIPLTPFLEILFILALFQVLYEVSLRLPSYLGLATSIVGALILGDTGVKAGLISPPGVMVIALSIIAVYTVPDQVDQINLLRVVFIILGGGLGIYGVIAGIIFIIAYLNSIENYGIAYLAPYSPRLRKDLKDGIMKKSLAQMKTRPESLKNKNKVRLKYDKKGN